MQLSHIPFETVDWSVIPRTEHRGEQGLAYWRTRTFGEVRVRMAEYTPGYVADHWCDKGHILLCLQGELTTQLQDGRRFTLKPGMSYQVADGQDVHRSTTIVGATLFIVD
ncbi:MAG: DHCW motif cupin fold protein [Steroidobacter sp.]